MLSAVAVVITQLPEFSSHGNLVKQFPPGVGFRDPRRLRVWLALTPWLEGNGGEEAYECGAPGLRGSWHFLGTPKAVYLCQRRQNCTRINESQRVLPAWIYPQSSRKFYADSQEAKISRCMVLGRTSCSTVCPGCLETHTRWTEGRFTQL